MSTPFLLIASIIALGALYVLLPQFLSVFRHWRKPRRVTCPEKGGKATVGISPYHAAFSSLFDSERRRVKRCSLWSNDKGCKVGCLKNLQ